MQQYLEAYAKTHGLAGLVSFRTEVQAVRPVFASPGDGGGGGGGALAAPGVAGDYSVWREGEEDGEEEQVEPRWRVSYKKAAAVTAAATAAEEEEEEKEGEELFDAVVVCNGHFDVPYTPPFPGLGLAEGGGFFKGRVLHSRQYDDPGVCAGRRVLCVGYKSSGTDIARCVALRSFPGVTCL